MNRPYIVCHMMASLDGRIDCAMTEKLEGTREYEETLQALNAPTTLSGRVTAQLEMAGPGEFVPADPAPYAREGFSKKTEARGYQVVVDTQGRLLWDDAGGAEAPLVIVTSQQVPKEYLADLDAKHISWIACGEAKIDLARAVELLAAEFGVERLAVVGGGSINAGFLDAGLLDEISVLVGPGIDGRGGMTASFDGRAPEREPVRLRLERAEPYQNGAVWLRYSIQH